MRLAEPAPYNERVRPVCLPWDFINNTFTGQVRYFLIVHTLKTSHSGLISREKRCFRRTQGVSIKFTNVILLRIINYFDFSKLSKDVFFFHWGLFQRNENVTIPKATFF